MVIGDGFTDPINQINYAVYLYQLGCIDANGRMMKTQKRVISCIEKADYKCASRASEKLIDESFRNSTGLKSIYKYLKIEDDDEYWMGFLNTAETIRAIHVGNNSFRDFSLNV